MKDDELADALARRIWEERDVLHWEDERDQPHSPGVPPTTLRLSDGTTMRIRTMPWHVDVDMAGHRQDLRYYAATTVIRAWRAVQAAGILLEMGDAADPEMMLRGTPTAVQGLLRRLGRRPKPDYVNVSRRLDAFLAGRVAEGATRRVDASYRRADYDGNARTAEAMWTDAGDGVMFMQDEQFTLDGTKRFLAVMHQDWGTTEVPSDRTRPAMLAKRDEAHVAALTKNAVPSLPPPASGNARIARVARLCRKAVAMDPDLADRAGSRIAPLVDMHLPALLRIHAEAAATAPAERLADVDMSLESGVETIRQAVEEALLLLHDRRMDEMATQLRFLETRHPQQ